MKMKSNVATLKAVFVKHLLSLAAMVVALLAVVAWLASMGVRTGFLYPANHVENIIRQVKPVLASSSEIKEGMIPEGCGFAVFDKNFKVVKTNMKEGDLPEAALYAKGLSVKGSSLKQYCFIERQDGCCILQYNVQVSYSSEWMNEHFPKPEYLAAMIMAFGCLFSTVFVAVDFAKNLKSQLVPLMRATEKIKQQDLNFDVGTSGIKEFNDVLFSISDMKTELKQSLEQQWNLEQSRREQVSALAHDVKTPLTIVKGNAELLCDTSLDEEQQSYARFILKNANQIEKHVTLLAGISKTESGLSFSPKKTEVEAFVEEIASELDALARPKQISIEFTKENLPEEIAMDKELMFRCLENVMSNAVEHTPEGGFISFHVAGNDECIRFVIMDSGKGFTGEALKYAAKQFYMGDASRNSKEHFGLGLYIADSIARMHDGRLILENSPDSGGGKVTVEVPLLEIHIE